MEGNCYFGDIHNHCDISYGHGTFAEAIHNARLQLDFVSVTGHSSWPDIPERDPFLQSVVAYHRQGFQRLVEHWSEYVHNINAENCDGSFVTLSSYEVHSLEHGDYVVVSKIPPQNMLAPSSIPALQRAIVQSDETCIESFLLPHHIGYAKGYRGIDWAAFDQRVTPLVEIISMHGCSESDEAPYQYLHTMGPRNGGCTMQTGLARGYHFGVTGSTDHHSAHPGSHGYGRVGVWSDGVTRDAIWEALRRRRCFAITGDRMEIDFRLNYAVMGSILPFCRDREIALETSLG